MAECSYESHLTLMISFPLYHLNFLPTVSVSSKQRRPDLDLCLFIPKSPFASNSDPNTTILLFFSLHILLFHTLSYHFLFLFSPPASLQPCLFLISSISFVNGYSLFIFLISVFLDGILSLSVVFFTCLLVFPFFFFFFFPPKSLFQLFRLACFGVGKRGVRRQAGRQVGEKWNSIQKREFIICLFFLLVFFSSAVPTALPQPISYLLAGLSV